VGGALLLVHEPPHSVRHARRPDHGPGCPACPAFQQGKELLYSSDSLPATCGLQYTQRQHRQHRSIGALASQCPNEDEMKAMKAHPSHLCIHNSFHDFQFPDKVSVAIIASTAHTRNYTATRPHGHQGCRDAGVPRCATVRRVRRGDAVCGTCAREERKEKGEGDKRD
jgi:hypothetical protein